MKNKGNLGNQRNSGTVCQCLDANQIVIRLRGKIPRIRLPRDIDFAVEDSVLRVFVNKPTQNMQTDGAAFEGWIIALKAWLPDEIKYVELDFSLPDNLLERYGNPIAGHYNRFLYRINNLLRLFPDWFSLHRSKRVILSDFMHWLESSTALINHSLRERESVIETNHMERQIESWLVFEDGKEHICKLWGIDRNKLFNQLPIGVFYEKISAKTAIFTRGASAIDLWGIGRDGQTLHMIELKCGDNKGLGVISETLFYTAVIYDSCIKKEALFQFGRYLSTPDTKDSIAINNDGNKFKSLFTHIMAEAYHPLLNNDRVEALIREGLSNLNVRFDRLTYDYGKKAIVEDVSMLRP
jgi:hypothetical protein